jgi:hypothetical protein
LREELIVSVLHGIVGAAEENVVPFAFSPITAKFKAGIMRLDE